MHKAETLNSIEHRPWGAAASFFFGPPVDTRGRASENGFPIQVSEAFVALGVLWMQDTGVQGKNRLKNEDGACAAVSSLGSD